MASCVAVGIVISGYVVVSFGATISFILASALALLLYAVCRRGTLAFVSLCFFFCLMGLLRSQFGALSFLPHDAIEYSKGLSLRLSQMLHEAPLRQSTIGLLETMLLGVRENMDSSVRDLFRQAGASHVLALSGLHLGILFGAFSFWIQWVVASRWRYVAGVAGLTMMWGYALLTGFPVSLCRAALMMSLLVLGQMRLVGSNSWHTLGVAAFLLLMLNPQILYDVGFQLSFAAVAGILLFYGPLTEIWRPRNTVLRYVFTILMVSMAAQLVVLPLSLYYFHQYAIVSLFTSPIIILLTTVILYLAVLLFALLPLGRGLLVAGLVEWLILAECRLMDASLVLPGSRVVDVYLSTDDVIILYAALLCLLPSLNALKQHPIEIPNQRLAMLLRTWPYLTALILLLLTVFAI